MRGHHFMAMGGKGVTEGGQRARAVVTQPSTPSQRTNTLAKGPLRPLSYLALPRPEFACYECEGLI